MQATLKRTWDIPDGSVVYKNSVGANDCKSVKVHPGTYTLERIPNPLGFKAPWLVIAGTMIGMCENAWRQWTNGTLANDPKHPNFGKPINWGKFEIKITE